VRLGYSVQGFEMLAKENGVVLHSLNRTSFFNEPKEVRMFYQGSSTSNIEYNLFYARTKSKGKFIIDGDTEFWKKYDHSIAPVFVKE
jgi:hypothetical protein